MMHVAFLFAGSVLQIRCLEEMDMNRERSQFAAIGVVFMNDLG